MNILVPIEDNQQKLHPHSIGAGTGGVPQYFIPETLLISIHAAQIAASVYYTFGLPKMESLPTQVYTQ